MTYQKSVRSDCIAGWICQAQAPRWPGIVGAAGRVHGQQVCHELVLAAVLLAQRIRLDRRPLCTHMQSRISLLLCKPAILCGQAARHNLGVLTSVPSQEGAPATRKRWGASSLAKRSWSAVGSLSKVACT